MNSTAIRQAIELFRIPSRAPGLRASPLPPGIEELLRLLARDAEVEVWAEKEFSRSGDVLREAAAFYAIQILLDHRSHEYRVLGCDFGASRQELRSRMAYLLQWLHPDHNSSARTKALTMRVLGAWNVLKEDEHRTEKSPTSIERSHNQRPRSKLVRRTAKPRQEKQRFWANRKIWIGLAIVALIAFFLLPRQLPQFDLKQSGDPFASSEFEKSN